MGCEELFGEFSVSFVHTDCLVSRVMEQEPAGTPRPPSDPRTVRVEVSGAVATLEISRPARRNALDADLCTRVTAALREVDADENARVVVVKGASPAFCAGADFGDFAAGPGRGGFVDAFHELLDTLAHMRLPSIAAVSGPAIGAGCQLLVQCDLRIASVESQIGITGARIGLMLDMDNINRLVCEAGPAAARRILLTGDLLSADEAFALGMIHAVAADEVATFDMAAKWAENVAMRAPLAVQGHKAAVQSIVDGWWLPESAAAHSENSERALRVFGSDDLQEGLSAFSERRPPEFEGR